MTLRSKFRCLPGSLRCRNGLLLLFGLGLLAVTTDCGRKGPPVAPQMVVPIAVSDLSAKVNGQTVVLEWQVPGQNEAALPDGYRVYRARLAIEDCKGCPLLFQRIGEVALHKTDRPASGGRWTLSWQDPVEVGFHYVYKVSAYGGADEAVDSNLVSVRLQP